MDIVAKLEALLFYYGEPVSRGVIAKILHISEEECEQVIIRFEQILNQSNERGLCLIQKGALVQLATKPELKEIGEAIIKDEFRETLTPAALETLALIAYLGPVSRATIDYIRGVNSSYSIRNLSMRGLVERGEEKGAMFQYSATENFLKHIGFARTSELPEYERFHNLLTTFARTQENITEESRDEAQQTPFDDILSSEEPTQ